MQADLFKDRTAIVTGGARGIGLACAAKIAEGGGLYLVVRRYPEWAFRATSRHPVLMRLRAALLLASGVALLTTGLVTR